MTREIQELEKILADMKEASRRFDARIAALRESREVVKEGMRFLSDGTAYWSCGG